MITPELVQFIKSELAKGSNKDLIINRLKTQNWSDIDIAEAFNTVSQTPTSSISNNVAVNTSEDIPPLPPFHTHIKPMKILLPIIGLIIIIGGGLGYKYGYLKNKTPKSTLPPIVISPKVPDSTNTNSTVPVNNNTNNQTINSNTNPAVNPADESKKDAMTYMKSQAELFYSKNNSYKGFCMPYAELGSYQLAIKLPTGSVYKCNDNSTTWAAWVKLSNNEYFCVDSIGSNKSMKNTPSGTSCGM